MDNFLLNWLTDFWMRNHSLFGIVFEIQFNLLESIDYKNLDLSTWISYDSNWCLACFKFSLNNHSKVKIFSFVVAGLRSESFRNSCPHPSFLYQLDKDAIAFGNLMNCQITTLGHSMIQSHLFQIGLHFWVHSFCRNVGNKSMDD